MKCLDGGDGWEPGESRAHSKWFSPAPLNSWLSLLFELTYKVQDGMLRKYCAHKLVVLVWFRR